MSAAGMPSHRTSEYLLPPELGGPDLSFSDWPGKSLPWSISGAAASSPAITHLPLYEPSFRVDDSYRALPADLAEQFAGLVSTDCRSDAVELYQAKAVGIPAEVVASLRR